MKITIKINGAEVLLEAQKPEEIIALGPLATSILEGSAGSSSKRSRYKSASETGFDSELAQQRLKSVEWVLSTSSTPMNAPQISAEVCTDAAFYTKAGDPIHIVRRVLAEGVQGGMFLKTTGGLFTVVGTKHEETVYKPLEAIEAEETRHFQNITAPRPPSVTRYSSLTADAGVRYTPPEDDDMDDPFADN